MKKLSIVLIIVLSALMLFSCAKKEEQNKVYVFATDATWPPLEYIDESIANMMLDHKYLEE